MLKRNDDREQTFGFMTEGLDPAKKKKRKVDVAALQSEFKRTVPSLDITVARDLIDCGFTHIDDLRGRAPEVIFEQIKKLRPQTPDDHLWSIRMMVYYAETPEPERNLMQPHMWQISSSR